MLPTFPMKKLLKVVLIEDDQELAVALQHIISYCGHSVAYYENSIRAVKDVTKHPEEFDAVITDLQMPHMDGQEVIKRIRKASVTLPIIVITANEKALSQEAQQHYHIHTFITKPFDISEIERCIDTVSNDNFPPSHPVSFKTLRKVN